MNIDEEREELRRRAEALNELGALLERVQAHAKYLSSISVTDRNDLQKLWVLGYEGMESKMAAGTEDSLREAALNLLTLDRLREVTTNEYVPMVGERPRFSFFGRRYKSQG
jgi:hypothetical protein